MIRLLIADDEALERETLADIVARRFEHEVTPSRLPRTAARQRIRRCCGAQT